MQYIRNYLCLLGLNDLVPRPLRLFVRVIGNHHLTTFHHALGGRHLDPTCEHSSLPQDARGNRVPAHFRAPIHFLGLVVRSGYLGGEMSFRVHGLHVAYVVVAFPGALHEQPAAARPGGRRRRRHLFRGFGEPVHVGLAFGFVFLPAKRFYAHDDIEK